ncbi:PAS domain S-box-containing protein [Dongia mobilis]|uniref:histidine kinase n=1 Tax=Dongia mobilis TaxID=578943 RepID=A0A4R6WPH9_9PROT|nr:PAS domain-containing sensor histidine kinase [Dongia mobilis]TDQ80417.1 PAS domain S-box-containing protein [Dongia mobilis]
MKSDSFHRLAFETIDVGIYLAVHGGPLLSANQAFARMLGFADVPALMAAIADRLDSIFVDPQERQRLIAKIAREGHLTHEVSEVLRPDGQRLWISQSVSLHRDSEGNSVVVGTAIDVTALIHSQQRLREAEERYRSLFDNAVGGIYVSSLDGGMISANQALARINGYDSPEELIRCVNDIGNEWYVDPNRRAQFVEQMNRDGIVRNFESEIFRHKTRERIWISENARLIRDADGKPLHYEGSVEDISERKKVERQLLLARREAESSNRAKSEFLANMSHELRTPLNAIMGFSELTELMTRDKPELQRINEYARDIHGSAGILVTLISEILDYSKLESGKAELDEQPVDMVQVVEQATTIVAERARQGAVTLRSALQPGLPMVRGDRRRLLQVLLNLLTNAVKFTPRGGSVTIGLEVAPAGDFVLSVRDSGIGIPAADLGRIFEPFVQSNRSSHHQREGTGLGLAICRSLIELHQGSITIDSRVGHGTTVRATLPSGRVLGPPARVAPSP